MASPSGSLADPFNTTALNTAMWTASAGGTTTLSYATTGVSINLPSTATASDWGQIVCTGNVDLTGSTLALHVITATSGTTQASGVLYLQVDGSNWLRWLVSGGGLYGQYMVATVQTTPVQLTYNSSTHAYWRISENAGVVTWWTSTDGVQWTSGATASPGLSLTGLNVSMVAFCYEAETSPGTFKFNQLNSGRIAPRPFTKQQAVNRSYTY